MLFYELTRKGKREAGVGGDMIIRGASKNKY